MSDEYSTAFKKRRVKTNAVTTSGCLVACLIMSGEALPQGSPVALVGSVKEVYSERGNRNAYSFIQGLTIGRIPEYVDPGSLIVRIPPIEASQHLCFRATTMDGVYWASGSLRSTRQGSLASLKDSGYSQYYGQLKGYRGNQFASRFAVGKDCTNTDKSLLLPVQFGTAPMLPNSVRQLHVSIQSGSSVRPSIALALDSTDPEPRKGHCALVDGQRKAFDYLCSIPIGDSASEQTGADLLIKTVPARGPERTDRFRVWIGK